MTINSTVTAAFEISLILYLDRPARYG